jgi:hypothetical protein
MPGKHPITDHLDEFFWCQQCERVFAWEDWQPNFSCPNPKGCDGTVMDMHGWSRPGWGLRINERGAKTLWELNGYPKVPVLGAYYPLFPEIKDGLP